MSVKIDRLSIEGYVSGENFEKKVKKYFQNGYIVERIDSKKHLPDFIVNTGNYVFFVESKVKLECKTVKQAIAKWGKQQPTQYAYQKAMFLEGWDIQVFLLIKTGCYLVGGKEAFCLTSE